MVSVRRKTPVKARMSSYSLFMASNRHKAASNPANDTPLFNPRRPRFKNVVIREVRDRESFLVGSVIEPHDNTPEGVIAAAQTATDRMYAEFCAASNGESRICATDATGNPRWAVSPNFLHIGEVGTDEASYIWHGPGRADQAGLAPVNQLPARHPQRGRTSVRNPHQLSSVFQKIHRVPKEERCVIDEARNVPSSEQQRLAFW